MKIKIKKHKENEWRGVVAKKKRKWVIKNNLFAYSSWKSRSMFQNKDKNLITNNYLFVMKVLKKY